MIAYVLREGDMAFKKKILINNNVNLMLLTFFKRMFKKYERVKKIHLSPCLFFLFHSVIVWFEIIF